MRVRLVAAALLLAAQAVSAQSNVGELLDKGGRKVSKDEFLAMLPFNIKYRWPQGGGEGDLHFKADGTLSGTEFHFQSRSESPATGTWVLDEIGKLCVKKVMQAWNSKTDLCWFSFRLGDVYYQGANDSDRSAKVFEIKSVVKQ